VSLNRLGPVRKFKEGCRLKRRLYECNTRQKQIKTRTLLENEECGTLKGAAWRNKISAPALDPPREKRKKKAAELLQLISGTFHGCL